MGVLASSLPSGKTESPSREKLWILSQGDSVPCLHSAPSKRQNKRLSGVSMQPHPWSPRPRGRPKKAGTPKTKRLGLEEIKPQDTSKSGQLPLSSHSPLFP